MMLLHEAPKISILGAAHYRTFYLLYSIYPLVKSTKIVFRMKEELGN